MKKYFNRLEEKGFSRIIGPFGQLVIDENEQAFIHSNKFFNKKIDLFKGLEFIGRKDIIKLLNEGEKQ